MNKIKTIRQEGGSKVMTVTNILPKEWAIVEVVKKSIKGDKVTVTFERVR